MTESGPNPSVLDDVIQKHPDDFEKTPSVSLWYYLREGEKKIIEKIQNILHDFHDVRTYSFIQHSVNTWENIEIHEENNLYRNKIYSILNKYPCFSDIHSKQNKNNNWSKKRQTKKEKCKVSLIHNSSVPSITSILNKMGEHNCESMVKQFKENVIMYPPHEIAYHVFEHSVKSFEFSHLYIQLLETELNRLQTFLSHEIQKRIESKKHTVSEGEEPSDHQRISKNTLLVMYKCIKKQLVPDITEDCFIQWLYQLLEEGLKNKWYQNCAIRCDVLLYLRNDGHYIDVENFLHKYSKPYRIYFKLLDLTAD